MAYILLARALIAWVPFARWRGSLGQPMDLASIPVRTAGQAANPEARLLAKAVKRAVARLPGESRCLPQAMALQWLLRRRSIAAVLHIGVVELRERGDINDLHAWVERGAEVLIGDTAARHTSLYAAEYIAKKLGKDPS